MLALLLTLAQAPTAEELLGEKPEATDRQLQRVRTDGCTFGPSLVLQEAVHAALIEAVTAPRCSRKARRHDETVLGEMILYLTVLPDGSVEEIRLESEEIDAPVFEACIRGELERVTVPANPKRGLLYIRQPLNWT